MQNLCITGFATSLPNVQLTMDVPSRLAERLAAGDLDVALIPSVEYLRGVDLGYEIMPGFAIAARGPGAERQAIQPGALPAESSGWHSTPGRGPARRWRGSGSTPATEFGPRRIEALPLGVPVAGEHGRRGAGDRRPGDEGAATSRFHAVVDLGEAWQALTGLPFVFALWVARPGVDLGDLPEALARSRAEGLAHADALAADAWAPARTRFRDVLRLLDASSCRTTWVSRRSPGCGGSPRWRPRLGLAPEGVNLVFHRRRDLAARR